jgi:hypothetical protein
MNAARAGLLLDWRSALPLALCFQQLLRGAECFELNGSNVVRQPTFFLVEVKSAKNVPEGFLFTRYQSIRRGPIVSANSWQTTSSRWA